MPKSKVWLKRVFWLTLLAFGGICLSLSALFLYLSPGLPSADALRDTRLQVPLRIYTADGSLIGEFGEMRRTPLAFGDVPLILRQAILAAEDDRFHYHHGVDVAGLLRAAMQLAASGSIQSGGSTITMQVARNYFLSSEQTFLRKFTEILLALQIERRLSKKEIFELYLNKIYLGSRAYGVAAAASVYYGKPIRDLNLAQHAMIAGLPKAPSTGNPRVNPARAKARRNWVLERMLRLEFIDEPAYRAALAAPVTAKYHGASIDIEANYAAEMVRRELLDRFGPKVYTDGYIVRTTLDGHLQTVANAALRDGLLTYHRRHGLYPWENNIWAGSVEDSRALWLGALGELTAPGGLQPGFVVAVEANQIEILLSHSATITVDVEDQLSEFRPYLNPDRRGPTPADASEVVTPGDLVRLIVSDGRWLLTQIPTAQAALVSLDAADGAIRAVVGGFDFFASKFNRITQALRLPGSNIKPFIYAGALEGGFTPASRINDAPIVFNDRELEEVWRPENDSGRFYGPTSLRTALINSRNLVSIRLLKEYGVGNAIEYLSRFGFDKDALPRDLSLALGTHAATPLQMASAYASLANGGFRVYPYLIETIEDLRGEIVYAARPQTACQECSSETKQPGVLNEASTMEELLAGTSLNPTSAPELPMAERIMEPRVAYIVDSLLRDAVQRGTGRRAKVLNRPDIAGKTGTTNGPTDAWFSGYIGLSVTTAWLGFDNNQPLGNREYGGSAALPVWIDFMRVASRDLPETIRPLPPGLANVLIDPNTGLRARPGQAGAVFELFRVENMPAGSAPIDSSHEPYTDSRAPPESIF